MNVLSVALLSGLLISCSAPHPCNTPDELGKAIFKTFQSLDFHQYKKLTFNELDIEEFYQKKIQGKNLSKSDLKYERKICDLDIKDFINTKQNAIEKCFFTIRDEAGKAGLKWSDARFLFCDSKEESVDISFQPSPLAQIDIYFSHKNTLYQLHLSNCQKMSRGWVNGVVAEWIGPIQKGNRPFQKTEFLSHIAELKEQITLDRLKKLRTALDLHLKSEKKLPPGLSLYAIMMETDFVPAYLAFPIMTDGWGTPLAYRVGNDVQSFAIASGGPDKQFGGWPDKSLPKHTVDGELIFKQREDDIHLFSANWK